MNMIPVDSSNIASIGYDCGTLYIQFHKGGLYSYSGVPIDVYRDLMSASSHGQYFHAHIKGVYPYTKIR